MQVDIGETVWKISCVSCGNIYYDLCERYKRIYIIVRNSGQAAIVMMTSSIRDS